VKSGFKSCSWKKCHSTAAPPNHEKLTNFGSLGSPSSEMPLFLNRSCIHIRLASSKPTFFLRMIFCTCRLPSSSNPPRLSPASMLSARLNDADDRPASASPWKVDGMRW
jgi:hypothetical protein